MSSIQPSAKMRIYIEGSDKSYILWNGTELYYEQLRCAYNDILQDKITDYLYFSFVSLCSATLEYSLNFLIADYCLEKFGTDRFKEHCEGYINIPFRKKLFMLPSIISGGEFEIIETNSSFKKLEELISLRNKILHNKEYLQTFDFPDIEILPNGAMSPSNVEFQIKIKENPIVAISKDMCISFGKALSDFKSNIMTPFLIKEMEENDMIVRNSYFKK